MAMEPITVFARTADPALVAQMLRELAPGVKIDGPDQTWQNAVVTIGSWWKKRTLRITHDPAYYSEPNWSNQMEGMRGYFSRFPKSENKSRVLMLIGTFHFSLGTIFEPDFDPNGDPRLDLLLTITQALDGVLFTPSSLRDAHGRILLSAEGEENEDPDATWPRVLGEVSIDEMPNEEPSAPEPPTPDRVARRALALAAVTMRGMLEMELNNPQVKETYQDLHQWIEDCDIEGEIEPDEWAVLQRPLGKLKGQDQVNAVWRLEGLVVLAWALRLFEIPPHDELVDTNALWQSLQVFNAEGACELLSQAELRPAQELAELQTRLLALHWRLRNYDLHPGVIDFAKFCETSWFGPHDISELLVDGDLSLRGDRIDRAERDAFGIAHSAARERHLAANWLVQGPEKYSEADGST